MQLLVAVSVLLHNPKRDLNIVLGIYIAFLIIALLTSFLPFGVWTNEFFTDRLLGYQTYIFGTYEGLILISFSIIFLNQLSLKKAFGFGLCGSILILFNIIHLILVQYWMDTGAYILIFELAGFFYFKF